MAREKPKADAVDVDTPGLAAGPGPAPPGIDDGTPRPTRRAPGEDWPQSAEQQGKEASAAERSAGTRGHDLAKKVGRTAPRRRTSAGRTRGRR